MNTSPHDHQPGTFTTGCSVLLLHLCFWPSVLLTLVGAWHIGVCLMIFAVLGMFMLAFTNAIFGEHSEPAPRQRVACHREVHARETVYFRPSREPEPIVEIPLSEYPPCKDPVTGHVYTYNELREKMLGRKV